MLDMMKRRQFITLLGGAAAAWPLGARAQQPKVPRIGVLVVDSAEPWEVVRGGLRDLGYIEGRNIAVEFRSTAGNSDALASLAADLVRLKVDVIVATFTPAVKAAKE